MTDSSAGHPDLEQYFDVLDGGLPAAVREHADACALCSTDLRRLAELRRQTRALPRDIPPPVDLWPGIVERIGDATRTVAPGPTSRPEAPAGRRAFAQRPWWLAAAAAVVLVAAAGALLSVLNGSGGGASRIVAVGGEQEQPSGADPVAPGLIAFASAEPEYRSAVESLEAELAVRREQLDPATIAVVERNLAIIDTAIAEAQRALAADPSSVEVPLHLSTIYRKKLELLQQAVGISARS